ncbi:hypothetical protein Lal_00021247 [Lupinus albus]|nr:hypothetical protein Lal_00021247 [Lupinus albus]
MRTKTTANKNHPPSKKQKYGTSGQVAPSFDRNRFTSLEREERYTTLLQWAFIPERRVEVQNNEYPEFLGTLDRLKWGTIASPQDKFNSGVLREFSANAYPPEEGGEIFEHKNVHGEEEVLVLKSISVPYVESTTNGDDFLHNFEVVGSQQREGNSHMHEVNQIVTQIMASKGYEGGKGLGVHLQGIQPFILVLEKFDKFEMCYDASQEDRNGCLSRRKKCGGVLEKPIPHISKSFTGIVGVISPDDLIELYTHLYINSLEEDNPPRANNIRIDEDDTTLQN